MRTEQRPRAWRERASAAGREGTHHRSWAPAMRRAPLSGHRQQRSWPRRCTGSPGHRSRSRRRSDSSAGRAAGPRHGGRPRTWGTSGESTPPPRTWLWGRGETGAGLSQGPATAWVPGAPRDNEVSYSATLIPASPSAAHAAETPLGSVIFLPRSISFPIYMRLQFIRSCMPRAHLLAEGEIVP